MKRLLLSLLSLSFLAGNLSAMNHNNQNDLSKTQVIGAILGGYAKALIVQAGTVYAHELGHYIAIKTLISDSKPWIEIKSPFIPIFMSGTTHILKDNLHELNSWKGTLAAAAGPLCGLLGCYAILKGSNIIHEYKKNKSLIQALKDGISKPLLNKDQSIITQTLIKVEFLHNLEQLLVPSASNTNDCAQLVRSLGIQNPHKQNPNLWAMIVNYFVMLKMVAYFSPILYLMKPEDNNLILNNLKNHEFELD